jgi:hypothetical protein
MSVPLLPLASVTGYLAESRMVAGAWFAFHGFILAFLLVITLADSMASQDEIVQAIVDLRSRLATTEAALQQTQDENVRLQTVLDAATSVSGPPPLVLATSPLVDTRLNGKPAIFAGSQEAWTDWSFVLRAYCSALSPRLMTLMESAQGQPALIVLASVADLALSAQLYYVLAFSCKGRALEKPRAALVGNGLEIWWLLCEEREPRQRMRLINGDVDEHPQDRA